MISVSQKESSKVKELSKIKSVNQLSRVKLNSNTKYHSLILESEDIIKQIGSILTLIDPTLEFTLKNNKKSSFEEYEMYNSTHNNDFVKNWIHDNPMLNQEIELLLKRIEKHIPDLQSTKMFDSLNFEQKLSNKKQVKCYELIQDNIKDVKLLITCVNSQMNDEIDQMAEVINLLKLD